MPDAAHETVSSADFVRHLWETGQVGVVDIGEQEISRFQRDEAWLQLQWWASEEQAALPGRSPGVSRPTAEWALSQFYRACSLLVHRTHSEAELRQALNQPAPEALSPAVCYSADIVFRFLPDLHRMACNVSPNDSLVEILADWGRAWPLSSVGMELGPPADSINDDDKSREHSPDKPSLPAQDDHAKTFDLTPWWRHDCLQRLYVDRVLRRGDLSRLTDVRVADAVRTAIGNYPELVPGISVALAGGREGTPPQLLRESE